MHAVPGWLRENVKVINAPNWDENLISELECRHAGAAHGLGQAAPNPVESALRFFAEDGNERYGFLHYGR